MWLIFNRYREKKEEFDIQRNNIRYLISMTEWFKVAKQVESYEDRYDIQDLNILDVNCGYNPADVARFCNMPTPSGLPQHSALQQEEQPIYEETDDFITADVGGLVRDAASSAGEYDLLDAIRKDASDKSKFLAVLSPEEKMAIIKEEQKKFYEPLRRIREEAEKEFDVSTNRASVKGFIPESTLRRMYTERAEQVAPSSFENLNLAGSYEELSSQMKALDLSALTSEQVDFLLRILEVKRNQL